MSGAGPEALGTDQTVSCRGAGGGGEGQCRVPAPVVKHLLTGHKRA